MDMLETPSTLALEPLTIPWRRSLKVGLLGVCRKLDSQLSSSSLLSNNKRIFCCVSMATGVIFDQPTLSSSHQLFSPSLRWSLLCRKALGDMLEMLASWRRPNSILLLLRSLPQSLATLRQHGVSSGNFDGLWKMENSAVVAP